jgi:micrococcal nuclease
MSRIHIYQAKIVEVVDGDTFDLMIDLGFNTFTHQRMRLYGIDAPEMRTQAGKDLAWNLSMQYPGSLPVIVQSVEAPKEQAVQRQVRAVFGDHLRCVADCIAGYCQRPKDP